MTQCEMILDYMRTHGSITAMDAFRDLGITRLASRVHDLRLAGYMVDKIMVSDKNRYGDVVRYGRYTLR